jgi:hypothetical protein
MARLQFPATARNRDPLLDVLRPRLPAGRVLEVASGSGEHAVYFAAALPHLVWQPTDLEPEHLASIEAWRAETGLPNVLPGLRLDTLGAWPDGRYDALFCANMVHIAPWPVAEALFAGAARLLPAGAPLLTYGPYTFDGAHTAPSNVSFDASLRARNPEWGVRDVAALAAAAPGFRLEESVPMPANNFCLVWRRG